MTYYISTEQLIAGAVSNTLQPSTKTSWHGQFNPCINEIKLWEVIYSKPNIIGVYAAWDPYVEFYIIHYPVLAGIEFHHQEFFGPNASEEVHATMQKYGIDLPIHNVWIESFTG